MDEIQRLIDRHATQKIIDEVWADSIRRLIDGQTDESIVREVREGYGNVLIWS